MTVPYSDPIETVIQRLLNARSQEDAQDILIRASSQLTSEEIYLKLTEMITDRRDERDLWGMAGLIACRGLLRRCRSHGIDEALADQSSWPLSSQGSLPRLLTLSLGLPPEVRIAQANAALDDVEPESEPDIYGLVHYNLGLGYQVQADAGSNEALNRALEHFEKAVEAWQEELLFGSEFLGRALHNLGRLYWKRRTGNRSQDLEAALDWLKQAVETAEKESAEQRDALILMGNAYLDRIEDERLENIERGIESYREAHRLAEQLNDLEHLGEIEHNLAVAYRVRLLGPRADDYERARKWAEQALERFDREESPEDWARTRAELATIYGHRQKGDQDSNLETAIQYAQEALEIYQSDTHPRQWALVQLNLGSLYCDRVSGVRSENEDKAIACFQEIIDRCDQQSDPLRWANAMNNLGTVYAGRCNRLNDDNYRQATDCYRQALKVRTPDTLPAQALQTAANWGNLDFWFGNWAGASKAFEKALQAGKALYQASSTEAGRRAELAETWQLVARMAYCWLRRKWPNRALLELEGGKARLLAEALALGDSDLDKLPATQRKAMLGARQAIRQLEAEMRMPQDAPGRQDDRVLAGKLQRVRADLDQLVQTIRAKSPDFMPTGLDLPGILEQIPEGGALVAPLVTSRGSAVFTLPAGTRRVGAEHVIPLDAFTDQDLNALLIGTSGNPGWLRVYAAWREEENGSLQDWKRAIETFTGQLWDALMEPIYWRLSELGLTKGVPVILMPQGGLGLLPLHAAWRQENGVQRAFLDDYTVSYAPSAYALSVSRRRLRDERRHRLALLAVVNPTGDLLYAPVEGRAVAELFPPAAQRMLVESEATPEVVLGEAPQRTYLHFACHGTYGWQDVTRSALVLAGRYHFTLSEIISKLNLDVARLVTLSACETGLTEFQQSPDEYVGLPAGFLLSGVPAVVASLWAVDDLSTALLMERFYHYHLVDGLGPADALRKAQLWLRNVPRGNVLGQLSEMERIWRTRRDESASARQQWEVIRQGMAAVHGMGERPFASPYYWGAFQAVGAVL